MKKILLLSAAALTAASMTACETYSAGKAVALSAAAKVGNSYCDNRDPVVRDQVMGRINAGLREEGARFTVLGVDCDQPE